MKKILATRGFLKKVLLVVLTIFIGLSPSTTVFSLTSSKLNMFSQNNILFYDPDSCGNESAVPPTGDKITWIGDSYSAINKEQIKQTFPGVDIDDYVKSSKWFEKDNTEAEGGKGGLTILKEIVEEEKLRPYLVFALGTNGSITETQIDKLVETAGTNTNIIIATLRTKNSDYASSNTAIKSAKTKYNNLYVADWESIAKSHLDDWFTEDGIHPQEGEAITQWISLIKNAMPLMYTGGSTFESGYFINENPFNYSGENPYSHWTGSCTDVTQWEDFLLAQNEHVRNVASEKGIPWEAMLAQAIQESGGGTSSIAQNCNNPLGLKGQGSGGYCDERHHAKFNTLEDAWAYYADRTVAIKSAQGAYANSPFSFIEYLQYGVDHGSSYAQCSSQAYITNNQYECGGHQLGDPTPGYVRSVSSIICGIQKWAAERNIPISAENFTNFNSPFVTDRPDGSVSNLVAMGVRFCSGGGIARNNGDIVKTALSLAWPMINGHRDEHGPYDPSPAYRQALTEIGWYDNANGENFSDECTKKGGSCDVFVATVMRFSGADPDFPIYLGTQKGYLRDHTEKYDAYDAASVDPQPGDIRIENSGGHIILIVELPEGGLGVASASHCDRSGDLTHYYFDSGTIYRLKTGARRSTTSGV